MIGTSTEILAYLKFGHSSIPSDAIIGNAKLALYCTTIVDNGSVGICRALSSWTENVLTWNNRPGGDIPVITSTPSGSSQYWRIDVTSIVKEWIENGVENSDFYLEKFAPTLVMCSSKEGSHKPHHCGFGRHNVSLFPFYLSHVNQEEAYCFL